MGEDWSKPGRSSNPTRLSDAMVVGGLYGPVIGGLEVLAIWWFQAHPTDNLLGLGIPLVLCLLAGPVVGWGVWRVRPSRGGSLIGLLASRAPVGGLVALLGLGVAWVGIGAIIGLLLSRRGMDVSVVGVIWVGLVTYTLLLRWAGIWIFAWGCLVGMGVARLTWMGRPIEGEKEAGSDDWASDCP